jgi:hypothetical protein
MALVSRHRHPVLSTDRLNRATLARQHLLEPVALEPVDAIEALGGLQAQEPASPYLALWTRLTSFDPSTLDSAFAERLVVKATLARDAPRRDGRGYPASARHTDAATDRRQRGWPTPGSSSA